MKGEMISFPSNGNTVQGYLANSAAGSGPGVIVLQEWWGLVGHIKDVADRFAEEGFTALAPDLYGGESTDDPDTAGKLMMALNMAETEKVLRGAVGRLLADEATSSSKVGIVGFCMGGQLSLYAACVNEKIGACVDYYGIHPNVNPPLENLNGPMLGFFAEHDAYANAETVNALSEKLRAVNKQHEFTTYPGTNHAFFNNDRPQVYNQNAAEDSWKKMVSFFRANLA
ncbi:MAG: dienelactone hydrolase family protein [Fimbriimonadales bacterium]